MTARYVPEAVGYRIAALYRCRDRAVAPHRPTGWQPRTGFPCPGNGCRPGAWTHRPRRRSHPCWCPRSHCAETIAALPAAPRHAWRGPWDARDPEQEFSRSTYLANTGLVGSLFILYSPVHLFHSDSGTRPCTAILLPL